MVLGYNGEWQVEVRGAIYLNETGRMFGDGIRESEWTLPVYLVIWDSS